MDKINRTKNGQFKKGTPPPNPKGRPRKITLEVNDDTKEKILKHYLERAKESDLILVDLVNRILK